jgi:type IV pilus assembly protein PilB
MVDPVDIFSIDEVRLATGLEIDPVIAVEQDIMQAIDRGSAVQQDVETALGDWLKTIQSPDSSAMQMDIEKVEVEEEVAADELAHLADEGPIVRLVNLIIGQATRDSASDIHVQPEENRVRVRLRIHGVLHDVMSFPKTVQASLISRFKVMSNMDIADRRVPQDGRMSLVNKSNGKSYDFRVSTLPGVNGEKVVLRILEKSSIMTGLASLGFSTRNLEQLEDLIARSYGVILVTGPTGSGKSTTLYAALNKINSPEKNILTIEDPVEYQLRGLTQTHVNIKAGLTFATALRSMLRQDPDIIMVGEIRDSETAIIATEAALTGHLVLSTLHTNDAAGAVTRLIEMGVEPFLVASTVIGVLAQRLVRTICERCKEEFIPPEGPVVKMGMEFDPSDPPKLYRGVGCHACRNGGYGGRTGVFELLSVDDEMRELILKNSPSHVIAETARRRGMVTLREDAIQKITQGVTTLEEAMTQVYGGR